ncbi:MAG: GntR family transcriptional regulator [Vicinamibacterales bacterium]
MVVRRDDPEAAYQQIARQIRSHVAAGNLPPGSVLPGVRTLASDLGVNLNTVARAYRLLEEQGFVRIHDRSGAEVVAPPRRADREAASELGVELSGLLARMRQAGLTPDEIRGLVERGIETLAARDGREA